MVWISTTNGYGIFEGRTWVPPEPGNKDWERYLEFLALGGIPQAAPAPAIATIRSSAKLHVAAEADALVARETPLATDALQRSLELDEARLADAQSGEPTATQYPLLGALIGVMGGSVAAVSAAVLARHASMVSRIAAITAERTRAQIQIDAQSDQAGVDAVVRAIVWPAASDSPSNNTEIPL